jgi:hypothetical protein
MKLILTLLTALLLAPVAALYADEKAHFIVEPEIFIHHTPQRSFIGPGMIVLENGDLLMAAPWGRPPTNFEQLAAKFPVPMIYRSTDGGRTWKEQGRMRMEWSLPGMVSDGGVTFLRVKDGRLAALLPRHVQGQKGGGLPVITFSSDDGATWTPVRLIGEAEGSWYVMNDRLIQLRSGRLLVPVAHMPQAPGLHEGDTNESLCFFSDDGGATWKRSREPAKLDDARGMQEPCVAEVEGGRVLMLSRTGSGFLFASRSDDGGDTWSKPEPTTLVSACSSLTLKTLPDGRLIVFYNHAAPIKAGAFFPRTPLCYAASGDGGRSWSPPVIVDDEGVVSKDRQNIHPSICFTKEGMLVMWSTHGADPKGSFAGQYDANIGGGKRAIIELPANHAAAPSSREVKASHVIVPHSKEAARNGEASLIELQDGSLLLMYGAHQKSGDWDRGEIRQMRSHDGGKTWSKPETVFSDAKRSLFQISFARLANGDLGLTHTSLANGRDAFKVFRRSTDDSQTWSGPLKISDDSHDYTTGPWF